MWAIFESPVVEFYTVIRYDFSEDGTDAWPVEEMIFGRAFFPNLKKVQAGLFAPAFSSIGIFRPSLFSRFG
ncbi:hypothetical protein ACVJGD_001824 [Bradyrhizobium sp. USDA 10063]